MKNDNKPIKLPLISYTTKNRNTTSIIKNIYFLNSIKNFKIKKENSKNNLSPSKLDKISKNKPQLISILNMSNKKKNNAKRISKGKKKKKLFQNLSFKNIYESIKKNNLKKSSSYNNINNIDKDKIQFESNFKNIKKESNIYTSNVNYINNKKMLLLEKYNYDNNIYKPDRLGLHEMSGLNKLKLKINKGIIGHIYLNHNKYKKSSESEDKF